MRTQREIRARAQVETEGEMSAEVEAGVVASAVTSALSLEASSGHHGHGGLGVQEL